MDCIDATQIPEVDAVSSLVREWVNQAAEHKPPLQASLLADALKDPAGLDFTVGFVDRVVRPDDAEVSARALNQISANPPQFLPPYLRAACSLGNRVSPLAPGVVVGSATKVMREMVSHLVLDARDTHLGKAIQRLRKDGVRLNINLLGEAVLGAAEARRRLEGVRQLLAREDVDYVSIKVSSIVDHLALWGADDTVKHVVKTLRPLYLDAVKKEATGQRAFINMDMEEYRDLNLTLRVFETLLSEPELMNLEAGIVLQAYLPDSFAAMQRLRKFAQQRVANGGAPIKVRLVKGANLAMERVDASIHGWPLATFNSKEESDAQYKRVLIDSLTPENLQFVRLGVAGHNLFDVAFTYLLAKTRGITSGLEIEMLAGMAPGQAQVVKQAMGSLLLYVPVVNPAEFDVAVSYLVRRLEENASPENFMSAVFELDKSQELFEREQQRFERALHRALSESAVTSNRVMNRLNEAPLGVAVGQEQLSETTTGDTTAEFRNEPDTDMSTAANQAWAANILRQVSDLSEPNVFTAQPIEIDTIAAVQPVINTALAAQGDWAAAGASHRANVLRRAAKLFAAHRADFLVLAAREAGKTLEQTDPEVSEAIDFLNYYAAQALELENIPDIQVSARPLTLVTPPWNFPVAIPTGSTVAALATGSAVVLKPAPQARRCGAAIAQLLWEAGVPKDVLQLVEVAENEVGAELIAHPSVDQVVLTGAYDTAALFSSLAPGRRVLAETSGKNSIIVSPHADLDLAVKDVVNSAFGHAGQKCSAASLVILVGSVAKSKRFATQLRDAVSSLHVGWPSQPDVQMGPVIEPVGGKLESGLTELSPGEHWVIEPKPLDDSGRLFTPGLRFGVAEGSTFHKTEYFGPILGVVTAESLADAIRIQNGTDYGLTAGLHSLDPEEIAWWLDHVEAGNVYVNRSITGAIVQRQPFGGWKRSAVGVTAKAGGPNYLLQLSEAVDTGEVTSLSDKEWLDRAMASDKEEFATTFAPEDVQQLHGEANILRYLPCPAWVRIGADTDPVCVARVLHAARIAGAPVQVSVDPSVDMTQPFIADEMEAARVETASEFVATLPASGSVRVRMLGTAEPDLVDLAAKRPEVSIWDDEVTVSGRIELLPFLHEQAISLTTHRYGNPAPQSLEVAAKIFEAH